MRQRPQPSVAELLLAAPARTAIRMPVRQVNVPNPSREARHSGVLQPVVGPQDDETDLRNAWPAPLPILTLPGVPSNRPAGTGRVA